MEEWVPVKEDLPQIAKGFANVSVDVIVATRKGLTKDAFYGFNQDKWFDCNGNIIRDVIAWKSK